MAARADHAPVKVIGDTEYYKQLTITHYGEWEARCGYCHAVVWSGPELVHDVVLAAFAAHSQEGRRG